MLTGILQPTHLIIILIVVLLVLGPKRLPDAGRAVGEGLKEFKNSISAGHDDEHEIPAPPAGPHQQDPTPTETRR
jgi:sec-independent protein translocase protein TatA